MTNAAQGQRDTAGQIAAIALGLVAFTIPLSIRINSWISVGVSVLFLIYAIVKKQDFLSFFKRPFFILIAAHLLVQLIGISHSMDTKQAAADIEKFALALLLPFLVYTSGRANTRFGDAMSGFIIGCISVSLYGFGYVFFSAGEEERKRILSEGHTAFTDIFNVHPFYLSIYLIFIFFYIAERIRTNEKWRSGPRLAIVVAGIIFTMGMIFFIRSQIALLIFVLLVVLYLLIAFKKRAAMLTFIFFSVALIVFLTDEKRVETFFDTYGRNVSTAVDNRHSIWTGALKAIGQAPFFGSGTGSEQMKLNEAYTQIGFTEGAQNNFNAHNQYLELMVRNGIVELAVFLLMIIYCFRLAQNRESFLFLLFMMMFCLSMIAESFINVQKGIAFFYFFAAVFIFLPLHHAPREDKSH